VEARPSRIERARRRAAGAKRTAVVTAVAAFLALVLRARETHPATSKSNGASDGVARSESSTPSGDDDFDFGSGSVAPSSGSQPRVQTHVS
jgi:hypothetical protein